MGNSGLEGLALRLHRDPAFRHPIVQVLTGAVRESDIAPSAAEWALLRRLDALRVADVEPSGGLADEPIARTRASPAR